jgi:hypothetical protein
MGPTRTQAQVSTSGCPVMNPSRILGFTLEMWVLLEALNSIMIPMMMDDLSARGTFDYLQTLVLIMVETATCA